MTDVTVIQGVPGAGKTYTLRRRVEKHLRQGDTVRYLNFTNAGTQDTEAELVEELSVDPKDVEMWFEADDDEDAIEALCDAITGTLHSVAYQLAARHELIDGREQVIMPSDAPENAYHAQNPDRGPGENLYVKFCRERGLNFAVNPETPMQAVLRADDIDEHQYATDGNAVFAAFEWARQKYPPSADRARKARQAPVDAPVTGSRVEDLYREWQAFKENQSPERFEHADYVDAVIRHGWTPDVDVVCVDEYQDLSPLEHQMLKTWTDSGELRAVALAGDTNQSVYSFRGADPGFMNAEISALSESNVEQLTESRRCSTAVAELARSLVAGMPDTAPITSHSTTGAGRVGVTHTEFDGLGDVVENAVHRHTPRSSTTDPAVMVLARTNRVAAHAAEDLRRQGIPYNFIGHEADEDPYTTGWSPAAWPAETIDQVAALRRVTEDRPVTIPQYTALLDALPRSDARENAVTAAARDSGVMFTDAVPASAVREAVEDLGTVTGVVEAMDVSESRREWIRSAVDRDMDVSRDLVQVGTVHSAKGLSAESVILLDAYPNGVAERYGQDSGLTAEERRVAYVGVTRAREEFQLVRGPEIPGCASRWPMFRGGVLTDGDGTAAVTGGETA